MQEEKFKNLHQDGWTGSPACWTDSTPRRGGPGSDWPCGTCWARWWRPTSRCAHALLSPSHPLPNINQPARFGRAEFQAQVYPVLAALASYNRCLEQDLQKKLIKCFEYGLMSSKCNQVCIVALTAFIFQMSGSTIKHVITILAWLQLNCLWIFYAAEEAFWFYIVHRSTGYGIIIHIFHEIFFEQWVGYRCCYIIFIITKVAFSVL